jgi:hypothetical protein
MRRPEDHAWRASSFRRFLPSSHAQTPAIAAFETGKVELRNGRAEIVAGCGTEAKKLLGHHRAHGVQPVVARTGAAVAIPIEAGARLATAAFEFAAEDIRGISHALILHRQSRFCRVLIYAIRQLKDAQASISGHFGSIRLPAAASALCWDAVATTWWEKNTPPANTIVLYVTVR